MAQRTWPLPIATAALLSCVAVLAGIALGGDTSNDALLAARYTARVAFVVFLVAYLAGPLVRLWPSERSRALRRARRGWGLAFALAHTVHLAALVTFFVLIGEFPDIVTVLGGGLAYVLILAMALTSNDAAVRALGVWWKRLHRAGIHWIWFVFAFTYLGRLSDPERFLQGAVLLPIAVAAAALRFVAWRRRAAS